MPGSSILFITHAEGGGIERHLTEKLHALHRAGRAWLVLRPGGFGEDAVLHTSNPLLPERRFRLPAEAPGLEDLLRRMTQRIEVHHLRSHHPFVRALPGRLGLPYSVTLHDYATICPRANLVGPDGRYCGEPDVAGCQRCVSAYAAAPVAAPGGIAALRTESRGLLRDATEVRVPSLDARRRFARHFPEIEMRLGEWEAPVQPLPAGAPPLPRVCVAGNVSRAKGFDILRACAEDAAARALSLDFVLVGRSEDDDALRGTGRCAVIGPYPEAEGPSWLAAQRGAIGFLPSVYPETWCYALGVMQRAGLALATFDIGAQAARTRASGGVVLPLGLPPSRINDVFLRMMRDVCIPANGPAPLAVPA
jgi:glycosyltransferase involved in cell wall biosynthesis